MTLAGSKDAAGKRAPLSNDANREHHEVFYKFRRWEGLVPEGFQPNFLGVMTSRAFFTEIGTDLENQHVKVPYPPFNEDYFEWIDVLEAVTTAEGEFTMIELGAGWGRWIADAATALKQYSGLPYRLMAVEAEPDHFKWMREHLQRNAIDLTRCRLIKAAVAAQDGRVGFYTGKTPWGGPAEWYGQKIGGPTEVDAVSLATLLRPLAQVDLLDLDVQGAELDVLDAAAHNVNEKVKRIHVETHNPIVETGLRSLFARLGWKKLRDYLSGTQRETEWGLISFEGGVQSWVNPKFMNLPSSARLTEAATRTRQQRIRSRVEPTRSDPPGKKVEPSVNVVNSKGFSGTVSPAEAFWNQRDRIYALRENIVSLAAAVNAPGDLTLYQWAQVTAFALEFRPDVVIELGRGWGNSTCCFLGVANQLGGAQACKVVSLCRSDNWFQITRPRLQELVPQRWFEPGEIVQCEILEYNFSNCLEGTERRLIFWDAHGFEVAECVLGNLLPQLVGKPNLIIMHDMIDARYPEAPNPDYLYSDLWKGQDAGPGLFYLDWVVSNVAQAISVLDFSTRNRLPLHSAAESFFQELGSEPEKVAVLKQMLGDDLFSLNACWLWFTLEEATRELTFPRLAPKPEIKQDQVATLRTQASRLQEIVTSLERQLETLRVEKQKLEEFGHAVEESAGWRALNVWRGVLDRMAPRGSRRRNLYEALLKKACTRLHRQ